jgi:hypothetical protein
MQIELIPIDKIKPYPNNPRLNKLAISDVAASIQEYGFRNPIVVDKDFVIINGHTRFQAAKQLGLVEVPVIVAKDLSEDKVKGLRIADNRSSETSTWDLLKLNEELSVLPQNLFTGFDLGIGFEIEDIGFGGVTKSKGKGIYGNYSINLKIQDKDRALEIEKVIKKMLCDGDKIKINY